MTAMPAPPFTHLGRYRILRELGRGAMGVVYLAEDETLQRQVAIKTLLLPGTDRERAEQEARFIQEAKAAGGLSHPNVITIHDLGRDRRDRRAGQSHPRHRIHPLRAPHRTPRSGRAGRGGRDRYADGRTRPRHQSRRPCGSTTL